MKLLRNILASAAAVLAVASCTIVPEDTFSTAPVAPVMIAHNDILITTGTTDEDVTFAWEKARFIDAASYAYDLFVKVGETEAQLANDVANTYYTLSKTDFRAFMKENFTLEQNTTHSISVYVSITDDAGEAYAASPVALKVYVYDDAVASVLSPAVDVVVLDKNKPSENVDLLTWTEPRLVYGEDVTYNVALKVGEGEESVIAEGLFDQEYAMTVDALNEAVVAAGGAEDAKVVVSFVVYACCPSIAAGVPSNVVNIDVTTYVATFSEQYYLPGNYQSWDPASAPMLTLSTKTKGLYQGFVDLTTADGVDAEFKFSPLPKWEGDFGFSDVTVTEYGETVKYAAATAKTTASDNIKVPSGLYYVRLNKKFNTLDMVQVKNLELIGSFAASNWGAGIELTWDADAHTWTAPELEFKKGDKFLARFNSAFDHKLGGTMDNVEFAGADIEFTRNDGKYKLVLDATTSDITVAPATGYLRIPGNHQGWNPATAPRLFGEGGVWTGHAYLDGEFKFTKGDSWDDGEFNYGSFETHPEGFTGEGSGNITAPTGFYSITVDEGNKTLTAVKTSWGIIGPAQQGEWEADTDMTWDNTKKCWAISDITLAADQMKFRANDGWDINVGGSFDNLVANGENITVEAGTYDIELYLERSGNDAKMYAVLTKK